jgi:Ca2+-binding EF-hand superfamily protein
MKKESILFASYLLGSVFAQDLSKSFGDGTLPEFLMRYDVNEDGIIDEEERQAVKEERKAARKKNRSESDPNRNSQTSLEERLAARNSIRERILSKRAEKFAKIAGKDGLLSLQELANLPPFKNALSERIDSIFKRLDSDGNGDVTLEEFNRRLRDHSPLDKPRPSHGDASPSNKGVGPGNNGNGNEK